MGIAGRRRADLDACVTLSLEFVVPNDGDTVRVFFGDLTGGDTFGLNGYGLQFLAPGVIPEQAALSPLGLGAVLALTRKRRTRK